MLAFVYRQIWAALALATDYWQPAAALRNRLRDQYLLPLFDALAFRTRHRWQRKGQDLVNRFHKVRCQSLELFWCQVLFHVRFVIGGKNHVLHAGSFCGEYFFLDPTHWQHVAA